MSSMTKDAGIKLLTETLRAVYRHSDLPRNLHDICREALAATEHITDTAATQAADLCRADGRCQYAIDHGAEGLGHCPAGKCCMPAAAPTDLSAVEVPPLPAKFGVIDLYERSGRARTFDGYTFDQMTNFYREGYAAGRASMKGNK